MKHKLLLASLAFLSMGVMSCDDFEDINKNPISVGPEQVKPYYSLSRSIIGAQMNPDIAERLFVIYWSAISRQDGEDGYGLSTGYSNADFNNAAFNKESEWLTDCNSAITLYENLDPGILGDHEKEFFPNIYQMARIWRAYLLAEFSDNFGPAPVNGFQGIAPTFSSVKDVYYYLLEELGDAVSKIDTSVEPNSTEAKCDPAYGFDPAKWKAYGISLRMRLAMRLSEADPAKAKAEFEAAVAQGEGIVTKEGAFAVQEYDGWDDWTGVMSRTWNWQNLSATVANLTTNLGGTNSVDALATVVKDASVYGTKVKDASTYAGVRLDKHYTSNTDNPTKQLFFDGLPEYVDPRALVYFYLPGDYKNRKTNGYLGFPAHKDAPQEEICVDENGNEVARINATFAWNGMPAGFWNDEDAQTNGIMNGQLGKYGYGGTIPGLGDEFRNNTNKRVFFGPWETYFLKAEAALRGWNVGTSAENAYNNGIKASFEYHGLGSLYDSYIVSEGYNRVGTSVKWSHTTEPQSTEMDFMDGYTKTMGKMTYNYPNPNNILYPGKKLNDGLTKIITQLYIANLPWLPQENWSNHRRLGLPFFEIPGSSKSLVNMPGWSVDSYTKPQTTDLFVQRLRYPASLPNADATGYQKAVELLGGPDNVFTPLWWAIGGH